jgi:outer membrane protein assembly factor BamB
MTGPKTGNCQGEFYSRWRQSFCFVQSALLSRLGFRYAPPLIALSLCWIATFATLAADWPQWRGLQRDGHSSETRLLQEWSEGQPKLHWQTLGVGGGFSAPSLARERIYLLGNEGLTNEFAMALSAKDGRRLWRVRLGKVGRPEQNPNYPGARSTPTVDGRLLYALGSDGDLVCLETAGGKQRWHKNLCTDFDGKPGEWAYAESPLIDGNLLVCTPGGSNATMVALNRLTGALVWKCAMPEVDNAGYASIVVAELSGVKQYVQFLAKGLAGVEARTGKLLWRYSHSAKGAPGVVVTPIVSDGCVFSSTAVAGGALIRPAKTNGEFSVEEVYYNPKLRFDLGGVIKVGDYLYGTAYPSTMCVEFKTGVIKWQERSKSLSCLAADGRLYAHADDGQVVLLEPTPEAYREKGRFMPENRPADHGEFTALAFPVLADGRLYIRELSALWCYDVKEAK